MPSFDYTPQEIATVLDEAAAYMEEHGWTQDVSIDWKTGAVCAVGAIMRVTGHNIHLDIHDKFVGRDAAYAYPSRGLYQLRSAAEGALRKEVLGESILFDSIPKWNDYKGRKSGKSVIAAFRATAAKLRAQVSA